MRVLIRRHAVVLYFVMAFAITWGGLILLSGGPDGFPKTKEQFQSQMSIFIPAVLGGPSVASILLTAVSGGGAGLRDLWSRFVRWRVALRWYAVALLAGPLVLMGELLVLSLYSPGFLPGLFTSGDKASLLSMGIVAGLVVGIFEELGWTGFATPRLRLRHGVFTTGLIVGVLWGAWHIFLNVVWASGAYSAGLSPVLFVGGRAFGDLVGVLPAFRVLVVWVYDRTESLLVAMLMHAGLTAGTMIFEPMGISGASLLVYDLASAVAMWAVVAAVGVASGWQLTPQLPRRRMA